MSSGQSDYRGKRDLNQELREAGHEEWALALEGCGTEVKRIVCESCGWSHVVKYHCKLKICPNCLSLRAFRIQKRYLKAVNRLKEPKLWTLTLKNTRQLGAAVRKIRKCFEKLRRRVEVRRCLRGGIYAIEVTPRPDGTWCLHIHVLCEADYLPQKRLSDLWREITSDSYIVDVRKAYSPKKGLKYLLEYLAKGPVNAKRPWPVEAIIKYLEVLEDTRLIQVFGCLLGAGEYGEGFSCPSCGCEIFRVENIITGEVEYSELEYLRWLAMQINSPP